MESRLSYMPLKNCLARRNYKAYNEKKTYERNIMSKHAETVSVNIVASIKLVPAIFSMINETIKEKKAAFADRVKKEIEYRKTLVNIATD